MPLNRTAGQDSFDSELMQLYLTLFTKLNQEGDGIWGRFNILVALNLAMFAGFAFVCFSDDRHSMWWPLSVGIAVAGALQAAWGIFVVHKLYRWHEHWKDCLRKIESTFPTAPGWVTPHRTTPSGLGKHRLRPNYAQPFLGILVIGWVSLLVLLLTNQLS